MSIRKVMLTVMLKVSVLLMAVGFYVVHPSDARTQTGDDWLTELRVNEDSLDQGSQMRSLHGKTVKVGMDDSDLTSDEQRGIISAGDLIGLVPDGGFLVFIPGASVPSHYETDKYYSAEVSIESSTRSSSFVADIAVAPASMTIAGEAIAKKFIVVVNCWSFEELIGSEIALSSIGP